MIEPKAKEGERTTVKARRVTCVEILCPSGTWEEVCEIGKRTIKEVASKMTVDYAMGFRYFDKLEVYLSDRNKFGPRYLWGRPEDVSHTIWIDGKFTTLNKLRKANPKLVSKLEKEGQHDRIVKDRNGSYHQAGTDDTAVSYKQFEILARDRPLVGCIRA